MPRTKLSRKAKKSRLSVYKKINKPEEELALPSPPIPVSSSSPLAVKSTASGANVSMATSSPSVHDITVTYDYSTEDVPHGNGSHPTTERFLALFPFTESPNTHKASTGKGSRLWSDLSPTLSTRSRKAPHTDNSSDLHQLNVIAQKLRDTLTDHKATEQKGMTFEPRPDCTARLNFSDVEDVEENDDTIEGGSEPCDPEGGYKECEDDWFWSQVALQVDTTTTPPGRKKVTPTTKSFRTNDLKTSHHQQMHNTGKKLLDSRNRLNRQTSQTCLKKPSIIIKRFPPTRPTIVSEGKAKTPYSRQPVYQTKSGMPFRPSTDDHEWGSSRDNDFIDQLLTQGVGVDPPQSSTQGVGVDPPQISTQGVVVYPPQSSTQGVGVYPPQISTQGVGVYPPQSSTQGVGVYPPRLYRGNTKSTTVVPKYSQEDIRRKRALAKQKLYTRLNKC